MTISDLKKYFFNSLSDGYREEETGAIFYILASEFIGLTRLDIALDSKKLLSFKEVELFEDAIKKLQRHEPVQYITGNTEFFGLTFKVNRHVLIPRPETEELVQWILDDLQKKNEESLKILDIGTGSGCIAVSLAKQLPQAEVTAIDVSKEALRVAKENAQCNKVDIEFLERDILQVSHLDKEYDLIVSNPPYVRDLEKQEMQKNVLDFEPAGALYVRDENPLVFYNKITALAAGALKPKAVVYFEINQYLGKQTEVLLKEKDFRTTLKKDIFGVDRMLKGQKS
jgi:release factor glutamine methyltransferase